MKNFLIISLLFVGFLNAGIVSKTTTKQAQGKGYGATYEEALSKALADAVGRMNGVKLSSRTFYMTHSVKDGKKSNMQKIYNDQIKKSTRGRFDSYEVLRSIKTSRGHNVTVLIKKSRTVTKYKTPGFSPHGRRKIAVIPIYSSQLLHNIMGKRYYSRKVTTHLTQEVVSAITQTRKFTVLDREANQAYESEKNLLLTDGRKIELVKLGSVLGTDYMYVLNVSDFNMERNHQRNDITGVMDDDAQVSATIEYRIIVMATRQVKYSNTKTFNFKVKGKDERHYFTKALKVIAKGLTDDIISNIYPVKIIGYSNGEVIISQKLNKGDKYEVFSLGKRMRDSYTKEQLGRVETKTGMVEIVRVTPKMSYGKVIEGNARKGDICRLQSSNMGEEPLRPDVTEEEKPSDVQMIPGGGAVLPFD